MYKKINRGGKHTEEFKPRRMVVGGVVHNIDSIETLNKIKDEYEQKKVEKQEQIEEQKQQRVLIKKTRNGKTDEKVVKIVQDIGQLQNRGIAAKPVYNKNSISHNNEEKPTFKLTSLACKRRIDPKPLVSMTEKSKVDLVEQEKIIENNAKIFDSVENKNNNDNDNDNKVVPQPNTLKVVVRTKPNQIKKLVPNGSTNNQEMDKTMEKTPDNMLPINKERANEDDNLSTHADNSDEVVQNDSGVISKQFPVVRSQWYILALKTNLKSSGLIKVFDDKTQIIPVIRINNDMFLYKKHPNSAEYRIYFKTLVNTSNVDIYVLGLNIIELKIQKVTFDVVSKGIDIWKLRKLYDLEFINYYLSNIKLDTTEKFTDRVNAEYELLKNPNYFDNYIKNVKIDTRSTNKDSKKELNKTNILYLLHSSMEYEHSGYNTRTQYLLQNINDDKYKVFGVTRYGYPYDKELGYYKDTPDAVYTQDNVEYHKLLTKDDNFNTNNLIEYLKKYIVAVVKLAIETDAKVIHGVSNYWSGIAALYASKYLGLKCVYELRGFMEENIILLRPELKNSDVLKMIKNMENKILTDCDQIITVTKALKNRLISNGIDEKKIQIVNNGVNTELFKPNKQLREELRIKHKISDDDVVIGYIGTITYYEGIEYILECLKKLVDESYAVKFLMIGDGNYKHEITKIIKEYQLEDYVIILDKMNHVDVISYYNMIDVVAYPRKNCDVCNLVSSMKLLESMSMEKAIIVSDLDQYNEVIKQDLGLFCEPDNTEDLLNKFKLLLDDESLRSTLGTNAREYVQNNCDWKLSKQVNNAIYDKLIC